MHDIFRANRVSLISTNPRADPFLSLPPALPLPTLKSMLGHGGWQRQGDNDRRPSCRLKQVGKPFPATQSLTRYSVYVFFSGATSHPPPLPLPGVAHKFLFCFLFFVFSPSQLGPLGFACRAALFRMLLSEGLITVRRILQVKSHQLHVTFTSRTVSPKGVRCIDKMGFIPNALMAKPPRYPLARGILNNMLDR